MSRMTRLRLNDLGAVVSDAWAVWLESSSLPLLFQVLHPTAANSRRVDIRAQGRRSTAGVRVVGGLGSLNS